MQLRMDGMRGGKREVQRLKGNRNMWYFATITRCDLVSSSRVLIFYFRTTWWKRRTKVAASLDHDNVWLLTRKDWMKYHCHDEFRYTTSNKLSYRGFALRLKHDIHVYSSLIADFNCKHCNDFSIIFIVWNCVFLYDSKFRNEKYLNPSYDISVRQLCKSLRF